MISVILIRLIKDEMLFLLVLIFDKNCVPTAAVFDGWIVAYLVVKIDSRPNND